MQLYDAIFYRKSIKKYSTKRLSIDMFEEVKRLCKNMDSLNKEIKINAYPILKGDSLKFIIKKRHRLVAPHYILLTVQFPESEDEITTRYLDSIGFAGEELVLNLTCMGLATSWINDSFNKSSVYDFVHLKENEKPVALIALGFPQGKDLFRVEDDSLDRKSLKRIAKNVDEKWNDIIECVRYAPSYKNTQPWRFYQVNDRLDIYMKKESDENINQINMGIALKHFEIGCKHYNIDFEYIKLEVKDKFRKQYYISVVK